jgi:cytochrome c2
MNKPTLTLLLLILFSSSVWADDLIDVPTVISKYKCVQCHQFSKSDSKPRYQGPDLFYAGNKFKKKWVTNFLIQPDIIRIAGHITDHDFLIGRPALAIPHPSLSEKEGQAVAEFLMSLKLDGFEPGKVDSTPLSKGQKVKIKILFERNYGCTACHKGINLARKPKGGVSGPILFNAGDRLNPDWIFHWLKNPKTFLARGRMPVFKLDDETTIQIVKYLMTLKKEDLR